MGHAPKLGCDRCGSSADVVMSRPDPEGGRIRRLHCPSCDHRWWTFQPPAEAIPDWAVEWCGRQPFINHLAIASHRDTAQSRND